MSSADPTTPWSDDGGPPVVAFGGNALLPDPDDPGAAERNAAEFASVLTALTPSDTGLILVHGNGPQVGAALLRAEAASEEMAVDPLDVLVAETQGSIGYLLSRSIGDAFRSMGREMVVAPIVTTVIVDPADPAMVNPSKPVGPFYDRERGEALAAARGWSMTEVPGRGMRRIVPSPPPIEVIEIDVIADAAAAGALVIAGGGGGVPVARTDAGGIVGVEAVIDKDRTAALIAAAVEARGLVILTEVDAVYAGFGTANQRRLSALTLEEARLRLAANEFPKGSMGPKVEACVAYAVATGRRALITSVAALTDALEGTAGTRIG